MAGETQVTCPFCGVEIPRDGLHPSVDIEGPMDCVMIAQEYSLDQWAMRPPVKECPPMAVTPEPEVVWLRRKVEDLISAIAEGK